MTTRIVESAAASNAVAWDDPAWERAVAGASAQAKYEGTLARHRERVRHRRPRILLAGAALVVVGIVMLNAPGTWPMLGWALVALGIFRTATELFETPANIRAWRIGSAGESRIGARLEELESEGFRVFHDRRRPGGRDNIDHFVIGPPGLVVIETKHYSGPVRVRGRDLYVNGRRKTEFVDQVKRQLASLESGLGVTNAAGVICVVDGEFPWFGSTRIDGIELVSQRGLLKMIKSMPSVMTPEEVDRLAMLAATTLRSA